MTPTQIDDRQWRLANNRARAAGSGTFTKGRVLYEATRSGGNPPAVPYTELSRGNRQYFEYLARHDPAPTPQNTWRRL